MRVIMKNLTTPQAILLGLGMIALAIASVPYSSKVVAHANANTGIIKIAICETSGYQCARVSGGALTTTK